MRKFTIHTRFILILTMFMLQNMHAQVEFQNRAIDDTNNVRVVYPSDIDGDGDVDFFAFYSDTLRHIRWYENMDGLGNFSLKEILSTENMGIFEFFPCDIDADGDNDLFTSSRKKVFWYENIDGQGNFSERKLIVESLDYNISSINGSDIDGDGDLDLVASFQEEKIVWYENINDQGTFGMEQVIAILDSINLVSRIDIADLDSDDDLDLVTIGPFSQEIAWYENTSGQGDFSSKILIDSIFIPLDLHTGDLDNDGDQDLFFSALEEGGKIGVFENTNGQGDFTNQNIATGQSVIGWGPMAVGDLDMDGDLEALSLTIIDSIYFITWFENMDNSNDFGDRQLLLAGSSSPRSYHVVDIDSDLDMDIIYTVSPSATEPFTANWFENLNPLNIHEYTFTEFTINPTLVDDYLVVESKKEIVSLEIYNNLGQLLLTELNPNKVDVSILPVGSFFCVVKDIEDRFGIEKIIKQSN